MISASPLLRRSTGRPGEFEALQSLDSDALGGDDFAFAAPTSDPVEAEESTTQPSLRVREALSAEGKNFFAFVADAISEKRNLAQAGLAPVSDNLQAETDVDIDEITFEELLPPPETSKMIACQGFLMLLSLGTKGMLDVQQPEAFEHITLKLIEKVKATRIIELEDGNEEEEQTDNEPEGGDAEQQPQPSVTESEDEEEPETHDSHFQEQMAADRAAADDSDDHDSLYN